MAATSTKKTVTKAASRKVKDRWKAKEWYKVYAPRMFNQVQLGETPSADPSSLKGRIIEATVHDLTGDFSKMHVKLKFQITEINGFDAHTVLIGQDLTSDYIRRLTRRKRTKTDHVIDIKTKDGYLVRVKPMSITEKRIQASQETAVRTLMTKDLQTLGAEMTISDIIRSVISGEMAKRLSNVSKVVVPIKRIEIRKTENPGDGQRTAGRSSLRGAGTRAGTRGGGCGRGHRGSARGARRGRDRAGREGRRVNPFFKPFRCRGGSAWWSVGLIG